MPARLKSRPQTSQDKSLPERLNAQAHRENWPTLCDERLAFDGARLNDLAAIWDTVRGGRPLPRRTDFTARTLMRHLRDIAFVERVTAPAHRYRFGFHGSGLARYTGDCTGKFLDELVAEQSIAAWYASYDTVLELGEPLRFVSNFRAFDLDYMTAESLIAPLGDANDMPCGLLISVVYTPRVK
jgi:hypothetical protein